MSDAKCGRTIDKIKKKKFIDLKKNAFSPPRSPKSPVGEARFLKPESKERKDPDQIPIRVKKCVDETTRETIPVFYSKKDPTFRRGNLRSRRDRYRSFVPKMLSSEDLGLKQVDTLRRVFKHETRKDNLAYAEEFVSIMKNVCDIPTFMGSLLFRRILNSKQLNTVSLEMVLSYWNRNMRGLGYAERLFRILHKSTDSDSDVLRDSDLRPLLDEIVSTHRGLRFLDVRSSTITSHTRNDHSILI